MQSVAISRSAARATPRAVRTNGAACANTAVVARFGGRDSNVLDRPDVEIKKFGWDTDKDSTMGKPWLQTEAGKDGAGTDKQRGSPPGGGNYRVLLLKDEKHTERGVVKAITTVIPGANEASAKNTFTTSVQIGMAVVISALKEHAEAYCMALYRSGCRVTLEPDTTTA